MVYPLWLMVLPKDPPREKPENKKIESISLILLSFNGKQYLKDKIDFLLKELSFFKHFELIIVDDNSSDGSQEILKDFGNRENLRTILKKEQKGIPNSMNLGVTKSRYETIVFCDQRQNLCKNIISRLVEPLKFEDTGAVSACIIPVSKGNCHSVIRKHENFLKTNESKSGSLIGVYGPLYSVSKNCYSEIPEHIILDDLYLSLKILKSKKIKILEDCQIVDDDFSVLYDYKRTRRYLFGFLQILNEKALIGELNNKQVTMLLWHKYLRLVIPFFLFACYVCTGIMGITQPEYLIVFGILSFLCMLSVLPDLFKFRFSIKNIIRINIFYFFALFDIIIKQVISKRFFIKGQN